MAQPGDFRVQNGIWEAVRSDGQWYPVPDKNQEILNRQFISVTGTGEDQKFITRGEFGGSVSVADALSGSTTSNQPTNQPSDANTMTQETLQYHWDRFMPGVPWPPKTGVFGEINTQLINSFLQSMRMQRVSGFTEGTTFKLEDAQGRTRVYGQPPGSDTLIELGIEGQEGTGTPEAVGIGGQQYFQQPGEDGQFERIPTEKGGAAAPKIETIGGIQFINQDGKLVPIDNMMKKMKENFVVTGDFQGAAAVHAWETRPSNQEYFDRMLQYVNAPADQLLISAIARGQGLVAPPPEETIQRIGPQPEYLTEAFNMLRDQMQMGQPGEGETAQSIMEQRALEREEQAADLAQRKGEEELRQSQQDSEDRHKAAVTANETAVTAHEFQSTINEMDLNDRITAQYDLAQAEGGDPGDFSFPESLAATGLGDMDAIDDDEVEPAGISAFDSQEAAGKSGTDLAERGGRGISMNDGSTAQTIQDFFDGLSDKQKEFVNGWGGGIWTFAQSAQNMAELERNLNFHFNNAPETVGKVITQVDGSSTEITEKGLERIEELGNEGESELAAEVIELAPELISEAPMEPGEIGEDEIQRAGTTGEGMSRDEIFEKYPFLAPEGWREPDIPTETRPAGPMSEEEMDVYGSTLGPTEAEMDVYGSTIPEPYQRDQTRPFYKTPAGDLANIVGAGRGLGSQAKKFLGSIPSTLQEQSLRVIPSGIQDIPFENISGDVRRQKADEAIRNQMMDIPSEPDEPTFVEAAPYGSSADPGMTASELGSRRELPFEDSVPQTPVGVGAPVPEDPDDYAGRYYDEGANGIRTGAKPTLVGESGPELALFPNGTEIVPLDRRMKPSQARRLRRRGVRGMQEGGIVFDDPRDNPLPLGIRQLQAGRSLGAPRGQLLRTAGIALPSAQARRRMLPGEREAFQGLGRMAGIPEGEFQQELGITDPSGARRTGSARMLPLSLRR